MTTNALINAQPDSVAVLLVSGNPEMRDNIRAKLQSSRWIVQPASSGAEALDHLYESPYNLMLLDPALQDLQVEEFKSIVTTQFPHLHLITVNPHNGLPCCGASSQAAAELVSALERELAVPTTPYYSDQEDGDADSAGLPGMVGTSEAMQKVYSLTRRVAPRDTSVLITGESGTGKDLLALAVHQLSPRHAGPFAVINCAAIPEPLLEAELFGYVKGAFTGAVQSRIGRIHAAQGGTLFLDEIGDMPLALQSKLLRFLEQGEVQRLGSSDNFKVDVRVVAATNASLQKLVKDKLFREDLYYRLAIFPIQLPPLRNRLSDIPILSTTFLSKYCPQRAWLAPESLAILQQHTWPGNVRELRNVMERASILLGSGHEILPVHISI